MVIIPPQNASLAVKHNYLGAEIMKCLKLFILGAALLGSMNAFAADKTTPHWSYEGSHGPDNWASLTEDFQMCALGKNQSPINIAGPVNANLPAINFKYKSSPLAVVNNGHTFQINFAAGSSIKVDNNDFSLKQVHFHSPSENLINGKSFPLEAHFVHADAKGDLAVVAVMYENGSENKALSSPWKHMPMSAGPEKQFSESINASEFLPAKTDYYRFSGSLTTSPCSEGVLWLVMKTPVQASTTQISQFKKILAHPNNRPVQMANARKVIE